MTPSILSIVGRQDTLLTRNKFVMTWIGALQGIQACLRHIDPWSKQNPWYSHNQLVFAQEPVSFISAKDCEWYLAFDDGRNPRGLTNPVPASAESRITNEKYFE